MAHRGTVLDAGAGLGLLLTLGGLASLYGVMARGERRHSGLQVRTLLCRRNVRRDIADLRVRLKYAHTFRSQETRRVVLVLRDGRKLLPLPKSWSADDPDFDAQLEALRALHRRHGTPEPGHVLVVTPPHPGPGRGGVGRNGYRWSGSPPGRRGAPGATRATPSPRAGTSPNSTTWAGRSASPPPPPIRPASCAHRTRPRPP
ncbi:hypothetical protein ACFY2Z_08770 [Streptomyces sp. NPDC001222]|uniref:hypothetical protein n=1 Tax=Streptomyces sp. NPDC001222 TaxID=3364548 RepID=UPI0036A19DF1